MAMFKWKKALGASALGLLAPFSMGAMGLDMNFDERILHAHNHEREALGIEPLRWNAQLAQSAQYWATSLAVNDHFQHAPADRANPFGENLWAGTKGYFSPEAMVHAWAREKQNFRPGRFPANSTTGNVADVGHYTQMIWRATHEVGCARATGTKVDILVCRYTQAGNFQGQLPF